MAEQPAAAAIKRCAYCLESPAQIAEAYIGTPDDTPATDLWAFLCVPDMERFHALPLPSDERADFIEQVTLHIREAETGETPFPHWTLAEIQPPLIYPEVLALFDPEELTEAVRAAWGALHWPDYVFLNRFPVTYLTAGHVFPEPKPKDGETWITRNLVGQLAGQRLPQNVIARLQQEHREPRVGLRKLYGDSLEQLAALLASRLADLLDAAACRALTYDEGEPPPRPELWAVSACRWRDGGPDAVENLVRQSRQLHRLTGVPADRLTITTPDLMALAHTESFAAAWRTRFSHLTQPGGAAVMPLPVTTTPVAEFVRELTGCEVVITDRLYRAGVTPQGEVQRRRVLPEGVVLFDRERDDHAVADARLCYVGPASLSPLGVRDPLTGKHFHPCPGPVALYKLLRRALPAQLEGQVVLRARPVQLQPASAVMSV
jgi:hypothetical protein